MKFFSYFIAHVDKIGHLFLQHVELTLIAVALAVTIGLPLGIVITKNATLSKIVLYVVGIIQTIPSIALFGFLIPVIGIGIKPAIVALVLYGQLPIVRNTYTGIRNVEPSMVEAARGMGMTNSQILRRLQIPAAFSVILGGIRIATVALIGIATIASFIGAGGLGDMIFRGIATLNFNMVLSGAIPVALLALAADYGLSWLERSVDPMYKTKKGSTVKRV